MGRRAVRPPAARARASDCWHPPSRIARCPRRLCVRPRPARARSNGQGHQPSRRARPKTHRPVRPRTAQTRMGGYKRLLLRGPAPPLRGPAEPVLATPRPHWYPRSHQSSPPPAQRLCASSSRSPAPPASLARTAWHSGREPQSGDVQLRARAPLRTLGVQRAPASFENKCSLEMRVHLS